MKLSARSLSLGFVCLFVCLSGCKGKKTEEKADSGSDGGAQLDAGSSQMDSGGDAAGPEAGPSDCADTEAFDPISKECVDCSHLACDAEGEVAIYHTMTKTGTCICETEPGYFYSTSDQKAAICDADKDGWVTIVAKQFLDGDDDALKENTRCFLRTIDKVVLEPEDSNANNTIFEIEPLTLYESSARDRDAELKLDKSAPTYGGQSFSAQELNSFSKACVNPIADYNNNSVPDVEEWEGHDDIREDYAGYARFAYFVELHQGWYESPDSGEEYGSFHIAEKSRQEDADEWNRVPVNLSEQDGEKSYWRDCLRKADAAFDSGNPFIGFDFASADEDAKMYHHSQFKCIQAHTPSGSMDLAKAPHLLNGEELAKYVMNECRSEGIHAPEDLKEDDPLTYNTAQSIVTCEERSKIEAGDVGLTVTLYQHYENKNDYLRGCVNECLEYDVWPGLSECEGNARCRTDVDNFGSGTCGCSGNYSYPECVDCLPDWDISTGCETCLSNWDKDNNCQTCLPGWDIATECTSCEGNWNIETGCLTCRGNRDEATNCDACFDDDLNGHWTGDNCDKCGGNWNIETNCSSCLNHWMDDDSVEGSDCNRCPADTVDGYWDARNNCGVCIQREEPATGGDEDYGDNDLAFGFWMGPEGDCTKCLDLFDETASCSVCLISGGVPFDEVPECKKTAVPTGFNPDAQLCTTKDPPVGDPYEYCDKWEEDNDASCLGFKQAASDLTICTNVVDSDASGEMKNFFSFENCTAATGRFSQILNDDPLKPLLIDRVQDKIKEGVLTKVHYGASFISCNGDTGTIGVRIIDSQGEVANCPTVAPASTDWQSVHGTCSIPDDKKDDIVSIEIYVDYSGNTAGDPAEVYFDDVEIYFSVEDFTP
ncbi:MAG: hypothetical protein GY854_35125 [Deltaproteobacteria bacterium]|nr:hypothetical protein [Deltaproteobacteria bacterium]